MTKTMRVRHRVSGQAGVLVGGRGRWYVAVRFDGDSFTSTVARDSVEAIDDRDGGIRGDPRMNPPERNVIGTQQELK